MLPVRRRVEVPAEKIATTKKVTKMVTKHQVWAKVQKMYRGFVKFNGYTVAVSCINYAITCVLNSKVDGGIGAIVPCK